MALAFGCSVPGGLAVACPKPSVSPRALRRPSTRHQPRRSQVRCSYKKPWSVSVDDENDENLFDLEVALDKAVSQEDFASATALRDDITRLQSAAFVEVLQAHMKFYKAFDQCSITDMARVWLQDPTVSCKHPVGPLAVGYLGVINSFGFLFSTNMPRIRPENLRIRVRGSAAYVTCEEVVEARVEEGSFKAEQTDENQNYVNEKASLSMHCVNIYVRRNGEYLLTHHSSSYGGPL